MREAQATKLISFSWQIFRFFFPVMLYTHRCSSDCWQFNGLLRDNGGQKSSKQSHDASSSLIGIECLKNLSDPLNHLCRSPFLTSKRALIAIIFIWLYNVLFAAIPSMVWRDAPDESLIFKEVCWFPQSRAYALMNDFPVIGDVCFEQRIVGSPGGKHCKSL